MLLEKDEVKFLQQSNFIEGEYGDKALEDAIAAWEYAKTVSVWGWGSLKEVHKLLLMRLRPDIAGRRRHCEVMVGGRKCPIQYKVPYLMGKWFDKHALPTNDIAIKQAHVEFERIHPFEDGNGRVGRIILNWQRLDIGLPILIFMERESHNYYKWFK